MVCVRRRGVADHLGVDLGPPALRVLKLLQHDDITQAELTGVRDYEISVEIPQETLRTYNLSIDEVAGRIRSAAVELPGGAIKTAGGDILVRVKERRDYAREFGRLPIITATEGVAGGSFAKIDIKRGDEIGQVVQAFNSMVDSLKEKNKEVTTLINALVNSLDKDTIVAVVSDPKLERLEFFNLIAAAFKLKKSFKDKLDFTLYFTQFLKAAYKENKKVLLIIDEAQNLTPHEIKTIITRAGEGSKLVFTGDIYQIDHPYLDGQSNGLSYLIDRFKGQKLYAHINLEKGERSELAELASNLL